MSLGQLREEVKGICERNGIPDKVMGEIDASICYHWPNKNEIPEHRLGEGDGRLGGIRLGSEPEGGDDE